jgi:hypothetical protein
MNLFEKFQLGLSYSDFLARYADEGQKQRWPKMYDQIQLTSGQRELLRSFRREMNVLCLAGTWCGDCVNQCPIFEHFAAATSALHIRYLDRDEHADVQRELQINGGNRIPVAVFFSEDGFEVGRYGERTLSKYRQMVANQLGPSFPTGIVMPGDSLLAKVTQEWLNEFERVQLLLQLSSRLRQMHGD